MKHIVKIAFLCLCAALILTACDRNRHTPEPEPQKEPISFSALSQTIPVKSETPLSQFHRDLGVWGFATRTGQMDYLIWEEDAMSPAYLNGDSYHPETSAYWFSGYEYNFIAIAPYTDGANRLTSFTIGQNKDALSFEYDMSNIYEPTTEGVAPKPGIDLMGAIAKVQVVRAADQTTQELTFHRLTSRVDIKVMFAGEGIFSSTSVDRILLGEVDADAAYTISYESEEALTIECENEETKKSEITLTPAPSADGSWTVTSFIIPQNISDFTLYLDFTINSVKYTNYPVTLTFPADDTDYEINEWHTWRITITPSLFVFFETEVKDWEDGGSAGGDDNGEIGFN